MNTGQKIVWIEGISAIIGIFLYFIFRIFILYNSLSQNVNFFNRLAIIIFYLGEIFILIHALGYFINILVSVAAYKMAKISYPSDGFPEVVVIISVHDEPLEVVRKTAIAAKYIDYPNFHILIVDGSDKEDSNKKFRELSESLEVRYFKVPEPHIGAKAGALNKALRYQRSKYIALFDADFRPSRDFLKTLVPQMEENTNLAYIQTPQFYGNLTHSMISKAANIQQSIFYEYLCEAKSQHDGTFMCGTNLIIRMAALREVNGFNTKSITEDFATSVSILARGWKSKYYNYTAAFGDGPLNMEQYLKQQYRWARGTLGLFLTIVKDIFTSPKMNLPQRWEFFLSGSYYFIGFAWMIMILLPIEYIFFRIPVYFANPIAYLLLYLPYFIFSFTFFLQSLVNRQYKIRDWLFAESLALLAVPTFFLACVDSLLGRKTKFEDTRKGVKVDTINWFKMPIQLFLIILSAFGIIYGVFGLLKYGWEPALALNVFWTSFHLILMLYLPYSIYVKQFRRQAEAAYA